MKYCSFVNASITEIKEEKNRMIIISDFSDIYAFYAFLDLLESGRTSKLNIVDGQNKKTVIIASCDNDRFEEDPQTIFLSEKTICLTKKLIADVMLNQAFPGYHLDLSLESSTGELTETSLVFC